MVPDPSDVPSTRDLFGARRDVQFLTGTRLSEGGGKVKRAISTLIAVLLISVSIAAQWPSHRTEGLPRDAQGRVRMDAPTPRTPDGRPDLSGMWMRADPGRIPENVARIYEANYGLRYIYTDGRRLPPQGEPQPFWYGYSTGRWEGDTLVVQTNNLRGTEQGPYDGWLDVNGSPYTDQVRFTERFRRPFLGKLEIDVTVEDSKAYTRPFTVRINQRLLPDEEPIEFICHENQQFRQRIKID
jgi:hypothetical protein